MTTVRLRLRLRPPRRSPTALALALAVLGVDTFPSLFLYGTALSSLSTHQRPRLHRVLGVAFFAMGFVLLSDGLTLSGFHVQHVELPDYQPLRGP